MNRITLASVFQSNRCAVPIDNALSISGNYNEDSMYMGVQLQKRAAWIATGNSDFLNVRGQDVINEFGWQRVDKAQHYYVSSIMVKSHWLTNNILMGCENHNRNTLRGTIWHLTLKMLQWIFLENEKGVYLCTHKVRIVQQRHIKHLILIVFYILYKYGQINAKNR